MEAFRLAITGSPGTGKSTISSLLKRQEYCIETVESLAKRFECIGEVDPHDGARPIDTVKLQQELVTFWNNSPSTPTAIDGHLSHHLEVYGIVILRCSPKILRQRLSERSYPRRKVDENVDWEILGGPWTEGVKGKPIIEFDSSCESPESIVEGILQWVSDGFKPREPCNPIDWVGRGEI